MGNVTKAVSPPGLAGHEFSECPVILLTMGLKCGLVITK
jgi:hypothetical protein